MKEEAINARVAQAKLDAEKAAADQAASDAHTQHQQEKKSLAVDATVPAGFPASNFADGPTSPMSPARKSESARLAEEVAADPAGNVSAMKAGSVFKSYDIVPDSAEQPAPQDVFVFLADDQPADGVIGSLYYNPDAEINNERSAERQLPLAATKDVFVGKHAWKKANATGPAMPSSRALSLVAGSKALHLEAKDDLTRAKWATGIRNVFEAAHKKADEKKKASAVSMPTPAADGASALAQGRTTSTTLLSPHPHRRRHHSFDSLRLSFCSSVAVSLTSASDSNHLNCKLPSEFEAIATFESRVEVVEDAHACTRR